MSERVLVSTRKGLFHVVRGSGGWRIAKTSFLGDNVTLTLHDARDGALYAALDHGHFGVKVQRSRDGGAEWEEIGVPAYPEKPADVDDRNPMTGKPLDWKLRLVWELAAGGAAEPGVLWCGTIPGGLFRSEDHGESWALVRSLWDHPGRREWFGGGYDQPGIHSILVDSRRAGRLVVGISCGGVWVTEDGGASWACQAEGMRAAYMPPDQGHDPNTQDPHRLAWCGADPDVIWCQHHNGIFRSTDGSKSWHEIEEAGPSVFGFAVAAHPRDPEVAWFIPANKDERRIPVDGQVVVTRTEDGGRSFEVLRTGLPQEHAYDLVLRHALDIDSSGERLAFGSTTGSLWISEDRGACWAAVSHHLPPVHAVSFA